jgi:hypothetical protein
MPTVVYLTHILESVYQNQWHNSAAEILHVMCMYLLTSYIQAIQLRLKNLLDKEMGTWTETEPLHHKTLHTFLELSKGCLCHTTFHFFIETVTYYTSYTNKTL